jgi:hypothetical protein
LGGEARATEVPCEGGSDGVRDIYFPDREITADSAEHVLLNGLGGRWEVTGLIDRATNNWFG